MDFDLLHHSSDFSDESSSDFSSGSHTEEGVLPLDVPEEIGFDDGLPVAAEGGVETGVATGAAAGGWGAGGAAAGGALGTSEGGCADGPVGAVGATPA